MHQYQKKISIKLLSVFTFVLLNAANAIASHMMGGEITYKWLGGKKYEGTARVYRDCRGIPFNSPDIQVLDSSGSGVMTVSYTRVSIEDITPLCKSAGSVCTPSNQTVGSAGVELHTFKFTLDFGTGALAMMAKSRCQVYIKLEQCCRNGAITVMNPGNFYVESMLDICNSGYKNSSPDFYSSGHLTLICNQPYTYNLGAFDNEDYDSLVCELVNPLNAHNSTETYNGNFSKNYPITPYCPPNPGVLNCTPVPTAKPPKGFYFNPLNGDIVVTPTKCDEVSVVSIKVSEYRKDANGVWKNLGFVVRDVQLIIKADPSYKNVTPDVSFSGNFKFKTGTKQCVDIVTRDTMMTGSQSGNKGDTTSIRILNLPSGAEFYYLDSNASSKTGRFCWKIHDSVYLQLGNISKNIPIALEVLDNYCTLPGVVRKTFFIKALAPDSAGLLKINTYGDLNKNAIKDNAETNISAKLRFRDQQSVSYYISTNQNGQFADSVGKGQYKIGVAPHPYLTSQNKDTVLQVNFNGTHQLEFGVSRSAGIYGRIYEDKNANCQFDAGEPAIPGVKVFTDSNKYGGVSDQEGIYIIKAPAGTYNLKCVYKPFQLKLKCPSNNNLSVTVKKDSIHDGNDFGISENPDYTDLGAYLSFGRIRRGFNASMDVYCVNKGHKTMQNVKLYMRVDSFDLKKDTSVFAAAGTTAVINVGTIAAGQTIRFAYNFNVSASKYKSLDKICLEVKVDSTNTSNDSVKTNNQFRTCGIVDAPFDPNDKAVTENPVKTTLDKSISYTIRFQNTGTAEATRIVVTDTIDTRYLDLTGFEMNWSQYPCEVVISGNVIHFIFDEIQLPTLSKAGDGSIGSFNFSLGLKSAIPNEQSFDNRASIYFDFEDPIITQKAHTDILSPVSVTKLAKPSFCTNRENMIFFESNASMNADNTYILEMSDASGDFSSAVTLGTVKSAASIDSIKFVPPFNLGGNFRLRIRTTSPASTSIPGSGITDFEALLKPDFQVKTNLNNYGICNLDTLKLEIISSSYQYKVIRNNVQLSDFNLDKTYGIRVNKGDAFMIVAKDINNSCTDTTSLKMTVFDLPVISGSITDRKNRYCQGSQLELNAAGGSVYSYYNNNILFAGPIPNAHVSYTLQSTSSFMIKGEDMNGCVNTSDTLYVHADPLPSKPVITGIANTLSASHTGTCRWYFNGSLMGISGNTITNAASGKYKVVAISAEGCENGSDEFTHINTGLPEIQESGISIYPNPANTILSIQNPGNSMYPVYVFDLSGKLVSTYIVHDEKDEIDVSLLSPGMYVLRAANSKGEPKTVLMSINR